MKITNEFKCEFPAVSSNESLARAALSAFLIPSDPTAQELADLRTVISEAVTNAIVHGYRHYSGLVTLDIKLFKSGRAKIVISDKGEGIEDIAQAMTPLFTTAPEEERAGLGFAIMESFCDKLKVKSAPLKGTSVTMEKYIYKRNEP